MRVVPPIKFTEGGLSRAGANATFYGSDGLLKTAAAGVPRFTYNPADTTAPPWLLLELAAATNVLLHNRDGTQAAWTKTDTTAARNQVGIDGAANTAMLYTQGSAGTGQVAQSATVAAGSTITASINVKRGNTDWVLLYATGPGLTNGVRVWFNTATGATSGLEQIGTGTLSAVKVVQGASGYWSVQLTGRPDAAYTSAQMAMWAVTAPGNTTRASGGTYIADYAQLEVGAAASSPILTGAANATRAADVVAAAAPYYISAIAAVDAAVGELAWVSGTSYAINDKRVDNNRLYSRKIAGAGTTAPGLDPINWNDVGPSNRQAMLDLDRSKATTSAAGFSLALVPGKRINTLALTGLQASAVRLDMRVGNTVYYSKTIKTVRRNTTGWLSYFVGAFRYAPSIMVMDLPIVTGAVITVTLIGTNVKCASVVVGTYVDMGTAEMGATADAINLSKIEPDEFGDTNLVKRRSIPTGDIRIKVPRAIVNSLRQVRADLNAEPALWTALDGMTEHDYFESFLFVGIYSKFNFTMNDGYLVTVTLQLREI